MEPPALSARQAEECPEEDDVDLSVQQLPLNPVAREFDYEDDSDEEFLPSPGGGMLVRSHSWSTNFTAKSAIEAQQNQSACQTFSHRRERSNGGPEDEPDTDSAVHLAADRMHKASQGGLTRQVSPEVHAVTTKNADGELDIQMMVMATVARAVAAGAIEAALHFSSNPTASTLPTQSAKEQLHDMPISLLEVPTSATVNILKCGSSECASTDTAVSAMNDPRKSKISSSSRGPFLNLKALAWCCK